VNLPRVGSGLDVHPFDEAREAPLVLGGVTIDGAPALAGHSDADVVAHAAADALLGAAALGDLGSRFGVDEPGTAGADSLVLLRNVVEDVVDAGWRVGNLDVTVVAERPRLAPHRRAMRERLADALGVDTDDVSVKFTTTDRLGAIGRSEGIAAWATCLLTPLRR
jgi:2-C-methyl-D-erythritol 2,4-cyclodiphosphate synthase